LPAHSGHLRLTTQGNGDVCPLSDRILEIVRDAGAERGVATVFVPGATAAITTMEFEPGGVHDLKATLDRLIPAEGAYEHNRLNYDTNSHAHIRAAIVGPSESIPIDAGRLMLGTWQEIVLIDFDDRPRERTVLVSIVS
jgi:secondary thiamine-phosphate synthase enzyme